MFICAHTVVCGNEATATTAVAFVCTSAAWIPTNTFYEFDNV